MKAKGLLSLVALSEKRRDILLMLLDEPKTLKQIKDYFKVTSPEILPQIRKLEKDNLIYQDSKNYFLTEVGEIVTGSFDRLFRTLKVFEKDMGFWKEHSIGIPGEYRLRLYELGDYVITKSSQTEIFKPHDEYVKHLLKSKWVKGFSPALHPEYPRVVTMLAENGVDVSLVITGQVFEKLKNGHKNELQKYLSLKNASLKICDEEHKVAFTTSDRFLSMRLFLKDGTYDFYKNIISYEKSALKWGEDLFRYIERRSEKVGLQDI